MKLYSPAGRRYDAEEGVQKKPAPYNWLMMLLIFIAYIMFTLLT